MLFPVYLTLTGLLTGLVGALIVRLKELGHATAASDVRTFLLLVAAFLALSGVGAVFAFVSSAGFARLIVPNVVLTIVTITGITGVAIGWTLWVAL